MNKVLNFGMVGGGIGSLIGEVHCKAASFDRKAKLVAGCFSRSYDNTLSTGKKLDLDSGRLYKNFKEMAEKEGARGDKIDFVIIVTPNNSHFEIARAFLEKGINAVCDKPLTLKVEEAEELTNLAKKRDLLCCVTYTYSGYPMVKHAREIISRGEIGKIRMVMGEYLQEWLAMPVEKEGGNKQASWRTDPKYSGKSNCVADIGSHVENIISYVTRLEIESLCANLDIFVEGRALDDNAEILLKYTSGARVWIFLLKEEHLMIMQKFYSNIPAGLGEFTGVPRWLSGTIMVYPGGYRAQQWFKISYIGRKRVCRMGTGKPRLFESCFLWSASSDFISGKG